MFTVVCVAITALVMLTGRDRSVKVIAGLFFVVGVCFEFSNRTSFLESVRAMF